MASHVLLLTKLLLWLFAASESSIFPSRLSSAYKCSTSAEPQSVALLRRDVEKRDPSARQQRAMATGTGTRMLLLLTLAAVVLVAVPASGREHARRGPGTEGAAAGPGDVGAAGAVGDDKAYIVGRPLFKVPPSSPCRGKSLRC
ncbi:hypothetical protein BS78_07G178200 [Paspalum vaginatum]|nr:hypothetical protein BS78_07G178200 [Paspalum vaginatum]